MFTWGILFWMVFYSDYLCPRKHTENIVVWILFMNSGWIITVICECSSWKNAEWGLLAVLSGEQITLELFCKCPSILSVLCNVSFMFHHCHGYRWQYVFFQCSPSCWRLEKRITNDGVWPHCKAEKRPLSFLTFNSFEISMWYKTLIG